LLRRVLGRGAFGRAYLAHDPQLKRDVVVKVLLDAQPAHIQRFVREGQALARMSKHPHIVQVFDAGQERDTPYIVSEHVAGARDLAEVLQQGRPEFRAAARIVRQLALALDHAHEHGVYHRDVKPANALLDARGDAYLIDFGLAFLEEDGGLGTREGTVLGTAAYMSPEQARGECPDDRAKRASDQYGLGALCYHLLCGRPPYEGRSSNEVLLKLMQGPPPSPRQVDPKVPRLLEDICLRAMTRDAAGRFSSCKELAEALRGSRPPTAPPAPPAAAPPPPAPAVAVNPVIAPVVNVNVEAPRAPGPTAAQREQHRRFVEQHSASAERTQEQARQWEQIRPVVLLIGLGVGALVLLGALGGLVFAMLRR
jgi:serine/threonine-protein kinase